MKNLRLSLGIAAIAIGSLTAFSFAPANNPTTFTTGLFYVNPSDQSMGDPVIGGISDCDNLTPDICSQEYNLSNHQPTNDPQWIEKGERP